MAFRLHGLQPHPLLAMPRPSIKKRQHPLPLSTPQATARPHYFDYWGRKAVSIQARLTLFKSMSWPTASTRGLATASIRDGKEMSGFVSCKPLSDQFENQLKHWARVSPDNRASPARSDVIPATARPLISLFVTVRHSIATYPLQPAPASAGQSCRIVSRLCRLLTKARADANEHARLSFPIKPLFRCWRHHAHLASLFMQLPLFLTMDDNHEEIDFDHTAGAV
jgi:hypothetical protein